MYGGVYWIEFSQGKVVLKAIVNLRYYKKLGIF
jgi:hypothetical protein